MEVEEVEERRLEGNLAVARSQVSMACSMWQQWGDITEYAEAGRVLVWEEQDVQENEPD
jgi:hypothetical protein